jgi:predicted DsbA family dithiol-disulfide isomerase
VTTLTVEIWSDVVCPWCYIGKRRWESGLAVFQAAHPDVHVDVAYRAFQLDPTAPADRSEPVRIAYEKKFGGPEQAKQLMDRVSAEAEGEGLVFDLDAAQRSNTANAHRLLVLAEKLGVQLELKERLMRAYFSEGREVGSVDGLMALAEEAGIDPGQARDWLAGDGGRSEVADQLMFAADAGIHSVPTFVINRSIGIPGAQPPEVFTEILERSLENAPRM